MSTLPEYNRRSYRRLVSLPVWLLFDEDKELVASVRASNADEARQVFKRYGLTGKSMRRVRERQDA